MLDRHGAVARAAAAASPRCPLGAVRAGFTIVVTCWYARLTWVRPHPGVSAAVQPSFCRTRTKRWRVAPAQRDCVREEEGEEEEE
jgi:hypothetical protein